MWGWKKARDSFVLAVLILGLPLGGGARADEAMLAIRGYDPVAYFTESRPVAGDPQFQYEWDGMIYRFASARHLEMFRSEPERYAPQFGNFCTASLSRGKRFVADPNNWTIQNGRLYLFGGPKGPGLMREDPVAMKTEAETNFKRLTELPWLR